MKWNIIFHFVFFFLFYSPSDKQIWSRIFQTGTHVCRLLRHKTHTPHHRPHILRLCCGSCSWRLYYTLRMVQIYRLGKNATQMKMPSGLELETAQRERRWSNRSNWYYCVSYFIFLLLLPFSFSVLKNGLRSSRAWRPHPMLIWYMWTATIADRRFANYHFLLLKCRNRKRRRKKTMENDE